MRDRLSVMEFLLVPDFPLYAVVPATEALRIANQNAGRRLFDWSFVSTNGGPVRACNGMTIETTRPIDLARTPDCVIVCAGNEPTQHLAPPLLSWLRRLAAHGSALGALDTGAFALAAAGVMKGYRMTLHWEAIPALRDAFPHLDVVEQIFVIDRGRMTAAGGTASLDMMLEVIAVHQSPELARIVADGFVHGRARPADAPQRLAIEQALPDRGIAQRCMSIMRSRLQYPVPIEEICEAMGLPRRQLERLLRRHANCTPAGLYRDIRLEAAREQLFYTTNSISHVASACGFTSHAHFCRSFRERFGIAPTEFRRSSSRISRQSFHSADAALLPDGASVGRGFATSQYVRPGVHGANSSSP